MMTKISGCQYLRRTRRQRGNFTPSANLDGNKGDSGGGGRSLGRDGSDRDHEEEDSKAKGKKC